MEQVGTTIEPIGPARATVGFFVGCMYNLRQQQSALDAIEVLRRNGIRVIVPRDQICCGSPLIRTGDWTMSIRSGSAISTRPDPGHRHRNDNVRRIGPTLKHDYVTPFEVLDINPILTKYRDRAPVRLPVKATYHDPCHLMRGQDIKDEPRQLIRQVVDLVEMPSICCGSGGGVKSGMPEEAAALGEKRREEIGKKHRCRYCHHFLPVLRVPYREPFGQAGEKYHDGFA